jgi:mono/diheme cytochrome c family protein
MRRARVRLALAAGMLAAAGCGPQQAVSPEAERGRQVYQSQCIACHNPDPAQAGPVGPPVKGSSRELLEVKVLRGAYPPGYTPKRPTAVMQPMPQLADTIPALGEYLK